MGERLLLPPPVSNLGPRGPTRWEKEGEARRGDCGVQRKTEDSRARRGAAEALVWVWVRRGREGKRSGLGGKRGEPARASFEADWTTGQRGGAQGLKTVCNQKPLHRFY
jgi:hypothetical protein